MRYILISLFLTATLSACGFKGPLYLPQTPAVKPAAQSATPASAPASAKPAASMPANQ
jgi:predicted small lipoprotein YifL